MSLKRPDYGHLLTGFRSLPPIHQAAVAGVLFISIYIPYSYFLLRLNLVEAIKMSVLSSIIFMVVYYFTSVIIMKKSMQAIKRSKAHKKGLRGK